MSDYFLADVRANEREKQREPERPGRKKEEAGAAQDVKITLLGDFLFASSEPQGCDPYNASNGRAVRDAWKNRRDRR